MAFPFFPLGLYSIVCKLVGYFMFFLGAVTDISYAAIQQGTDEIPAASQTHKQM